MLQNSWIEENLTESTMVPGPLGPLGMG
uniref:Uncharacterized protein n=1 Tax=Rhizophora mucronata TaxID=61149 RepID=A0A2P2R3A3_RHIMU